MFFRLANWRACFFVVKPVFTAPMLSAGNPRSLLALTRLRGLR